MSIIESTFKALLNDDIEISPRVSLLISSRFEQQPADGAHNFNSIHTSVVTEELRTFIHSELDENAPHLVA